MEMDRQVSGGGQSKQDGGGGGATLHDLLRMGSGL